MTVREFIEWLKTQDQDAVVMVLEKAWDCVEEVPFAVEDHVNYVDFRNNPYVFDSDPRKHRRTLSLGVS